MIGDNTIEMRICTEYIRQLYVKYGAAVVLYAVAAVVPQTELDPVSLFEED